MSSRPRGAVRADPTALDDVLADVLTTGRVGLATSLRGELVAPWRTHFPARPLVSFHIVRRGACFLWTDGVGPTLLTQGEMVLFAQGSAHALGSGPDCTRAPSALLLCGRYRLDHDALHPALVALPSLIQIPADRTGTGTPLGA